MSTRIGIVGMPNAGKSSLFNALTKAGAEAANYPFTTIEPNVAVVPVRDRAPRARSPRTVGASEIVYDTIDFHDIAGLVAGAHEGEGLGNRFLAQHPRDRRDRARRARARRRERDPPRGPRGPAGATSRRSRPSSRSPTSSRPSGAWSASPNRRAAATASAVAEEAWLREVIEALQAGRPVRGVPLPGGGAQRRARPRLADAPSRCCSSPTSTRAPRRSPRRSPRTRPRRARGAVAVSARIESELAELDDEDAAAMRAELGVSESGLAAGRARGLRAAAT